MQLKLDNLETGQREIMAEINEHTDKMQDLGNKLEGLGTMMEHLSTQMPLGFDNRNNEIDETSDETEAKANRLAGYVFCGLMGVWLGFVLSDQVKAKERG